MCGWIGGVCMCGWGLSMSEVTPTKVTVAVGSFPGCAPLLDEILLTQRIVQFNMIDIILLLIAHLSCVLVYMLATCMTNCTTL